MKILIFMFGGPISNNKEKINIATSPPRTPLAKIIELNFFEKYGEIDIYVWKSYIISNNKENRNFAPPAPLAKYYLKKNYLIDMKKVIFMFESPISNNKEN